MKAYHIPSGPKNLDSLFPSIDFEDVAEYYIEIQTNGGTVIGHTPNYNLEQKCPCEGEKFRLHFLNYLGGVDAANFRVISKEHEAKSDSYSKPLVSPLVKDRHGLNRFNVKGNDIYTIVCTDYGELSVDWLNELLDSPMSWMEWAGEQGQADSYIPLIILDSKIITRKQEDRYLYEIQIQVKLSHEKFILRN